MRILTLSQLSLAGSSGIAEAKIPLWWADGTTANTGTTATGTNGLNDGSTGTGNIGVLFNLSSSFSPSQKFAIEVTMYSQNASTTAYAQLYDKSSSALVGSSVSTSSTTATVLRSSQFTLTPSHNYGVSIWVVGTYANYLVDASLIIFP